MVAEKWKSMSHAFLVVEVVVVRGGGGGGGDVGVSATRRPYDVGLWIIRMRTPLLRSVTVCCHINLFRTPC